MSRYYSADPVRDAANYYADMEAAADKLQEATDDLSSEFIEAAAGDLSLPFGKPYKSYSKQTDGSMVYTMKHQSMNDVLFESLDYPYGPTVSQVLQLLADAAKGHTVHAQAKQLIARMADKWAEMNVDEPEKDDGDFAPDETSFG
jgi:hypothetical protein